MIFLQTLHFQFAPFHGPDGVQGGPRRGHGGGVGDVVFQGRPADGVGVRRGVAAFRGVDQQVDIAALDAVDDMGPAFPDLVDPGHRQAVLPEKRRGAGGGIEVEALGLDSPGPVSQRAALSASLTLKTTPPVRGTIWPAANCDLAKAKPKSSSIPMTSPVERISGPSSGSTPGKRRNGKTDSFTAK